MAHTVYEVKTPTGVYIGVTKQSLRRRLIQLRCASGIDGTIRAIAAFDRREDAFALERQLRPDKSMGLNTGRGGHCTNALWVRVDGVEYPTVLAAAKALGLKKTAAHYRFGSPYFPTWEYLTPPGGSYWPKFFADKKYSRPAISAALQNLGR